MNLYDWREIPEERVNAKATRQIIHTATITVIRRRLLKGSMLRPHRHGEEQVSMVEQGRLRFVVETEEQVVGPGQVFVIASDSPHSVEALEDSVVVDLFPALEI